MARTSGPAAAIGLFALGVATAAGAAEMFVGGGFILSNDWGNAANIGDMSDIREGLQATAVSGPDIVAEFKRLCLDTQSDAAAHSQAALASSWGFKANSVSLPPSGKQGDFSFTDYRSPSAITSLWQGANVEALKNRPYAARSRGAVITGPVSIKNLYAPQCNLSLKARGLSDAAPLAAALEQALGQPATKVVLKTGFADGNWKIGGASGAARRVSFDVVDMKKAEQLVHLTVQMLPAGKS